MRRREILKSAMGVAGSAGLLAASSTTQAAARQRAAQSFITTRDGTQLFYRDWGDGPAIVFLGGWALPSDIWCYRAEQRSLTLPTLLLHGDRDVSAPLALTARKAVGLLPQAELRICEGAPHGLMLTHAARLNEQVLAFARA